LGLIASFLSRRRAVIFLYSGIAATAVLLPILLWLVDLPFIFNTYGRSAELFELFTFFASVGLLMVAFVTLRPRRHLPLLRLLPFLLFLVVACHFLIVLNESPQKSWDYQCYETAATAVLQGDNLYDGCYLYPPLLAQVMAAGVRVIAASLGQRVSTASYWDVLFYLYQVGQWLAVIIGFGLCYHFARRLKIGKVEGALLVTLLFLLNNPLVRTLKHNQVNLWVMDLSLLAILAAGRYPLWSGTAVALGGHLKLYPLVLFGPWMFGRQWRPLLFGLAAFVFLLLAQAAVDQGAAWRHFLAFFGDFPSGTYFRDNSLNSLVLNTLRFTGWQGVFGRESLLLAARVLTAVLSLLVVGWLALRFWRREHVYRQMTNPDGGRYRLYGHSLDALALTLIVAPRVWEHHYVLALPLMVWAVAVRGRSQPWLVGIGCFLIAAVPTFDLFPFSYHRLAGLLLLLWLAAPECLPGWRPVERLAGIEAAER
jgi:hypothetical protein